MSSASSTCPSCGTVLSKNAPRGLCAKCLLVVGLDSPTEKETSVAGQVPENLNQNPPIPFSRLRYFGDYELIEEIGRGGMGLVFKARQVSLNRLVAFKLISSGTLATEVLVKRFKAEAETAASLSHPNIVPIYEIGEHDGQHYFSMGLIEGPTLRELLLARRRWSIQRKSPHAHDHSSAPTASDEVLNGEIEPREAVRLMIIIARAVHYAHQRGVLHRDIKPGNILLDSARQPHLTDFGLAKLIEKESTITHTHAVLGTPAYMAPEQARGDTKNVTTAVDVYGLGAVLYETLTGSPPFAGGTSMETIRQVLELEPRRPSHLNPRIDRDLETICLKCLEKLPEHRYASADALVDDLERWCAAEPIQARRAGTGERLIKWTRRKPVVAALTGSLALVAVIGLLAVVWQWRRAEAARREAIQRAADEQKARTRLAETISELEIQKAQEQLAQGQGSMALARLARVLRDSPTNQLAASRIVAALSDRNFVWPLTDPIRLTNRVTSQRFSRDGRFVMTQTWDTVEVWNALTGKAAGPPLRFEGPIIWADISSDGERVAIYARDKVLDPRIWEVRSGAILATLKVFTDEQRQLVSRMGFGVSGMELSPDGLWLLTVSRVNSSSAATIWDARTGAQLFSHNQDCTFAKFSRDGRKVLLFTYEGISRWNPLTGEQEKIAPASMRSMELSPDEQWAFSKEGFSVHIREAATGRSLPELLVHNGLINSIRFSPDHQRVVTVSSDWTGRIWDFQSGLGLGQPLQHAGAVQHGSFSPDGRLVATASHDKTARIWDAHTGIPLVEPIRHDRPVVFVDFSPDGQRLLTVTTNTIRLWHVGVDAFQAWASSAIRSQRTNSVMLPNEIPDWLPALAESIGGQRLTSHRQVETVTANEYLRLKQKLQADTATNLYVRWAKWFVADRAARPLNPFSELTLQEYVNRRIREDTPESLREVLRLMPTNGLAMARLARHVLAQDPERHPARRGEADYYSRRALEFAPDEPDVWMTRSLVLLDMGQTNLASRTMQDGAARLAHHPQIWNDTGTILEKTEHFNAAREAYSKAIEVAETEGISGETLAQLLLDRSQLLHLMGERTLAMQDEARAFEILQTTRTNDWPKWGGQDPGRNMFSPATGLPDTFQPGVFLPGTDEFDLATSRNIKWVTKIGSQSYGNPAIAGGRIFIGVNNDSPKNPRIQGDRSILLCLDERNGQFLWQLVIPKLASGKVNDWENLGLTSGPTVEGNRVYFASSRCEIVCVTTHGLERRNVGPFLSESEYIAGPGQPKIPVGPRDADIVWRFDMMEELGVFPHNATHTHPLIVGDLVYAGTCNGQDWSHAKVPSPRSPSLIALDKRTGAFVAEDDADIGPRIYHSQWSSPSTGNVGGRQLIFYGGGDGFCYAFDAIPVKEEDTTFLKKVWWVDCNPPEYKSRKGTPIRYPASEGPSEILGTPVFWKNRVYVATGQDPEHGEGVGNLVCIDATKTGDITETGVLWRNKKVLRSMSTVSITPDGLLFLSDFSGFVHCIDAETGQEYWQHDMRAHMWGSTLVSDGKVFVGDEDGDFVVLAASKQKKVLSRTMIDGKEVEGPNLNSPIYSTPVVANGVLYVTSTTHLFAIERSLPQQLASPRDPPREQ